MKAYILIKDSIDLGHAVLASAHAGAAILTTWGGTIGVTIWARDSFRKVVCKVTAEEFERFKNINKEEPSIIAEDIRVMTESGLNNEEVAIVFRPTEEWPKAFKFLKLYK